MKKKSLLYLFLMMIVISPLSARDYLSLGFTVDLGFNCDEEVIDEMGLMFPKPSIFFGVNHYKENETTGFHIDGNIILSHDKNAFYMGLSSLIGPSFLFPFENESGFIISPGLSAGFILGGSSDEEKNTDTTIGQAYLGIGTNVMYFFRSGFSIGLSLNYYPLMFVYHSNEENNIINKFSKRENYFSIGISIAYTDWFNY